MAPEWGATPMVCSAAFLH
ncbi:MAG TPA: hypothetical protein EYQ25_04925 [Planctomycetes bacterium]|nr:hypothetical protein [Planctomycetota bacterium]HIL36099.1 hypothetical protein [Planctomycetota bacterium]